MPASQLERSVAKREIAFPREMMDSSIRYALNLYERSCGLALLEPSSINNHTRELRTLSLPQRILVYKELRTNGRELIEGGEILKGAHYLKASHYFWEGFVIKGNGQSLGDYLGKTHPTGKLRLIQRSRH